MLELGWRRTSGGMEGGSSGNRPARVGCDTSSYTLARVQALPSLKHTGNPADFECNELITRFA
ncbi:Uncharacterised protein [Stenotrophomonas maltophilia]|nr:Uncharacterised protein [Stenotrophomonas maltophilia]